ncbi:MAG: response regulator [Geobacter sp.]|nr:response regulator [Geobacter sp.]
MCVTMGISEQNILLVDDEDGIRFTLSSLLKKEGFQVDAVGSRTDAIACFQSAYYDLAFVDIMLAGENGIDLLRDIKTISPATQVIMFSGRPEVASAAEAVRLGAFDYLTKPVRYETLIAVTRHAISVKKLRDEQEKYRANLDAIFHTVSDSIIMVDRDGRLAQFNAMAEHHCGYQDNLIGVDALSINMGCGGVCRNALMEALRTKSSKEHRRIECHSRDGRTRIFSINANPVTEPDGTVSGAVAVLRDETHLVALERTLQKRSQFHGLIGSSEPMQKVFTLIEALADVPTTVLINGESGTGKELVAAALHYSGVRSGKPFVKVNCSALSEPLLESELFGHVRGAFTGAISDKIGRFQKANGGTLFLDEIGDISPAIQMRLLRVLQESEFERVGESTPIKVDVRIIAATNQNLAEKVSQGSFRQDLLYRLNVVRLVLPLLKERSDDLALLVSHLIVKCNGRLKREIKNISNDVFKIFRAHNWPGNVRELEHVIEHASILCRSDIISVQDLPQDLLDSVKTFSKPDLLTDPVNQSLKPDLTLEEALAISNGNKTRAASLLGISRRTIYRHLEEL